MCYITIPFLSRSEDGKPLQRCIDFAAEESGIDAYSVVVAMSFMLTKIADEVTRGRSVRIPGFGCFSPVPIPESHRKKSRDLTPRCKPAFSPSRGFRQQVRFGASPSVVEARRFHRHEKNHAYLGRGESARVFTSMDALRDQVSAQLGRARD